LENSTNQLEEDTSNNLEKTLAKKSKNHFEINSKNQSLNQQTQVEIKDYNNMQYAIEIYEFYHDDKISNSE